MFSTIHKYNSFSTYLTQVHIISNPQPDSIYIKKKKKKHQFYYSYLHVIHTTWMGQLGVNFKDPLPHKISHHRYTCCRRIPFSSFAKKKKKKTDLSLA